MVSVSPLAYKCACPSFHFYCEALPLFQKITAVFILIHLVVLREKESEVARSCLTLCNPMDCSIAYQAPPSMEFSRQEYWIGLPFPSPGDLHDPGIKPGSLTLQADALPSEPPGKSSSV